MQPSPEFSQEMRRPQRRSWVLLTVLIGLAVAGVTYTVLQFGDERQRRRVAAHPVEEPLLGPPSPATFFPVQVVERFPPVTQFQTLNADSANRVLANDELVLAVEIDGQARAYPINMLTGPSREVINDELAGVAIAATW